MRILILHQHYLGKDEGGGSRFNQFAKYWAEKGHKVTIIAGTVHYATGKKAPQYKRRWLVREQSGPNIQVLRAYVAGSYNRSFLGRLWAYFSFALSATLVGLFNSGKQDVVIASSPPLLIGIPAYIISRVKRVPLVFEVRDLWPQFAIETGVLTRPSIIRLSYWLEKFLYRKARRINVLTPAFYDALVQKGVSPEKLAVITNGADLDLFQPGDRNNWVRTQYEWGDRFVVLYTGAHGLANQLGQLLEVARGLREDKDILLVLVGDGMEKRRLEAQAREYKLANVQFIETQPKGRIADFTNAADVGTAVLKRLEGFKTVYPNKVFDYMACAKPVILAIDGVARSLVEKAKAGLYAEPEDPDQIREAVLTLYHNRSLAQEYGRNGYDFVRRHFSRERLAEDYERLLLEVVTSGDKRHGSPDVAHRAEQKTGPNPHEK